MSIIYALMWDSFWSSLVTVYLTGHCLLILQRTCSSTPTPTPTRSFYCFYFLLGAILCSYYIFAMLVSEPKWKHWTLQDVSWIPSKETSVVKSCMLNLTINVSHYYFLSSPQAKVYKYIISSLSQRIDFILIKSLYCRGID